MIKGKKEKVAIYIDGANTYAKLKGKELPGAEQGAWSQKTGFRRGKKFNFSSMIDYLVGERDLVSKRYYVGIVRNPYNTKKGRKMVKSQQRFLSGLEKENFIIKRGRIMYDEGRIREKGVDVKLAVDLLVGAVKDFYDTALLVSSDTDLIPAVKIIGSFGKKVEYIGFAHSPSFGMMKYADLCILLAPRDIKRFVKS